MSIAKVDSNTAWGDQGVTALGGNNRLKALVSSCCKNPPQLLFRPYRLQLKHNGEQSQSCTAWDILQFNVKIGCMDICSVSNYAFPGKL